MQINPRDFKILKQHNSDVLSKKQRARMFYVCSVIAHLLGGKGGTLKIGAKSLSHDSQGPYLSANFYPDNTNYKPLLLTFRQGSNLTHIHPLNNLEGVQSYTSEHIQRIWGELLQHHYNYNANLWDPSFIAANPQLRF